MNYVDIIKECFNYSDFCKKLGYYNNGNGINKVKNIIKENNLDITHFGKKNKNRKYDIIEKKCICGKIFKTQKNRKEKETCSIGCSNTKFRSGKNHGNWKDISEYTTRTNRFSKKYREICFKYHNHKCVICDEYKILDVHHFDENIFNNKPDNLIPICATHHNYLHSSYSCEIFKKVIDYRNEFIKRDV